MLSLVCDVVVISNLLFLLLFNKFQNLKSQLLRHLYSVTVSKLCL